jgi:hypothetical protein
MKGPKAQKTMQKMALMRIRMSQRHSCGVVLNKEAFHELLLLLLPTVIVSDAAAAPHEDEGGGRTTNPKKRMKRSSSPPAPAAKPTSSATSSATWVERRGVAALQVALERILISALESAQLFDLNGSESIDEELANSAKSRVVMGAELAVILGLQGFGGMDQFTGMRAANAGGSAGGGAGGAVEYLRIDEEVTPVPTAEETAEAAAEMDEDDDDRFLVHASKTAWGEVLFDTGNEVDGAAVQQYQSVKIRNGVVESRKVEFTGIDDDEFKDSIPIAVAASLLRDPKRASAGTLDEEMLKEGCESLTAGITDGATEDAKVLHALGTASGMSTTRFHLDQLALAPLIFEVANDFSSNYRFTPAAVGAVALSLEAHVGALLSHTAALASAKAYFRMGATRETAADWEACGVSLSTKLAPERKATSPEAFEAAEGEARKERAAVLLSSLQAAYASMQESKSRNKSQAADTALSAATQPGILNGSWQEEISATGSKIACSRVPVVRPCDIQLARRVVGGEGREQ